MPTGLGLRVWGRYEIENYLLIPDLLRRFVRGDRGRARGDRNPSREAGAARLGRRAGVIP